MFLLDLLGTTAIVTGVGYVAVLGTMDAAKRVKRTIQRAVKKEVASAKEPEQVTPGSIAARILELIERSPADWKSGEHTFTHQPSGLQIWIANGTDFISIYRTHTEDEPGNPLDDKEFFSKIEKEAIWSAFRQQIESRKARQARLRKAAINNVLDKHTEVAQ